MLKPLTTIRYGRFDLNSPYFLALTAAFYIFVAYHSTGFHNADEHFQLIEFASYKMGWASAEDLAWEFGAKVRPGLQPGICFMVFSALTWFGITDVYDLAFALRALTALFAILVINYFVKATELQIHPRYRNAYRFIAYLLWFVPYINVRFSSEAWSGLFFIFSLAVLIDHTRENWTKYIIAGVLFGIAILFRYQTALSVLGAGLWLLFPERGKFSKLLAMTLSCLAVFLVLGGIADTWLYGKYTFTPYHYFHVNIIQDVASRYGVSPWYEYLLYILKAPGPLGPFIFVALGILLLKQPGHFILWVSMPFLIAHMLIPHKELRFLFPLANLCPLLLILAYQRMAEFQSHKWFRTIAVSCIAVLSLANLCGLVVVSTVSAGNTKTAITQYIHRHYDGEQINLLYTNGSNPYSDWPVPINTFYNSRDVTLREILTVWQKDLDERKAGGHTNLLILSNEDITGPKTIELLEELGLVNIYQTIPWLSQQILRIYDNPINERNLLLYEFKE